MSKEVTAEWYRKKVKQGSVIPADEEKTPEQREAIELIKLFGYHCRGGAKTKERDEHAKQCALLAISLAFSVFDHKNLPDRYQFLQRVKQEINSL